MSFTETIAFGALRLVATLYPKTAPFVAAAEKWGPSVAPVIVNALHEGSSALAAAEKAAPELAKSVHELLAHVAGAVPGQTVAMRQENVFRTMVGFPHLTPEQERAWMDRTTPHNDPSQENSQAGSG